MNFKKLEFLGLKATELREIKLIFEVLDEDGEGKVDKMELIELLKEMSKRDLHKSQTSLFISLLADIEDDSISFELFAEIFAIKTPWNRILTRNKKLSKENLEKVYKVLSSDRGITFESLKQISKELEKANIKEETLREVIRNGDSNKDGVISFSDFSKAILNSDLTL